MRPPTRPLGSSGLAITRVGFGAWAAGGGGWSFGWGPQDDEDSLAAMRRALEQGVNWIDTAPVYGLGHSEEVVGRRLRGLPAAERPLVFTKCGLIWDARSPMVQSRRVLEPESIARECEASLRRLGVERIDLYSSTGRISPASPSRIPGRPWRGWSSRGGARRRGVELRPGPARALRGRTSRGFAAAALLAHPPRRRAARDPLVHRARHGRRLL